MLRALEQQRGQAWVQRMSPVRRAKTCKPLTLLLFRGARKVLWSNFDPYKFPDCIRNLYEYTI